MTEPEVATALDALAALPSSWISPEFSATVARRASLQAVHRKVSEQASVALAAVNAAVTALAQDPSDAALSNLVTTQQTLTAIGDVQGILPPITIDASACAQAVAIAGGVLSQCAPRAPIVLDYQDEMVQWRNVSRISRSGANSDAPVATDADRAAQASWTDADAQVKQWLTSVALWRSPNTSDVLSTLGAAQSYIDRAATVADAVEAANKVTSEANAARAEQGLNWSAS
jgi:hypothetical protein